MSRRLAFWSILLILLAISGNAFAEGKGSAVQAKNTRTTSSLLVLSANLHVAAGFDPVPSTGLSRETVTHNLDLLAELFKSRRADVIALQEVDFSGQRTGEVHQAKYLAEKLGMHYAEAVALDTTGYRGPIHPVLKNLRYGVALLSRRPLHDIRRVTLSDYPDTDAKGVPNEHRVALVARLGERPDGPLICSLHLDAFSAESRSKQMGKLVQTLLPFSVGQPVIVAGDFNEPLPLLWKVDENSSENNELGYPVLPVNEKALAMAEDYQWFIGAQGIDPSKTALMWNRWPQKGDFFLQGRMPTFPADDPVAGLDHVLVLGEARISRLQPVDSRRLSDHRFVEAVIDLSSPRYASGGTNFPAAD